MASSRRLLLGDILILVSGVDVIPLSGRVVARCAYNQFSALPIENNKKHDTKNSINNFEA
jgi:hypothetical protein